MAALEAEKFLEAGEAADHAVHAQSNGTPAPAEPTPVVA